MESVSELSEGNIIYLDLNEFTVTEFINFLYEYYIADVSGVLVLNFFGDCDFRFSILKRWIMVSLNSEHQAMLSLLRKYPSSLRMDFTYCYCKNEPTILHVEDFQILRDIWRLHSDIKRIELTKHNITFVRFAPKRLTSLCMPFVDDNKLAELPAHVLKRLKDVSEDPFNEPPPEEDIGKCFRFREITVNNSP